MEHKNQVSWQAFWSGAAAPVVLFSEPAPYFHAPIEPDASTYLGEAYGQIANAYQVTDDERKSA